MNTNNTKGDKEQHQDQLSPSNTAFHSQSPFKKEFSLLLDSLPPKAFKQLLTTQQYNLAKAFWEACNVTKNLTPQDYREREPIEIYCKWVLLIDHEEQWRQHNLAKKQKTVKMST